MPNTVQLTKNGQPVYPVTDVSLITGLEELVQPIEDAVLEEVPSFGGLQIASGPLAYENGAYVMKEGWNHDSYESHYGKENGSTYFNFLEMGKLFEKSGFSTSDGDITNELDPFDGWRLPTKAEWQAIVGTTRAGSTVNGNAGKHYALVQLTGVTHAGSSTPNGLLIFPDNKTITGKALSGMDNDTQTTSVTASELNAYLEQGCVFLPASGYYYDGDDWYYGGSGGLYWSSTESLEYNAYNLSFDGSNVNPGNDGDKSDCYYPVRLVKPAGKVSKLDILEEELDEKKEDKANKVTSLSAYSTNDEYPSAKCVYDTISSFEVVKDLSYYDVYGVRQLLRSTANAYVVRSQGLFEIPLVYGNGIRNGVANTAAYTRQGTTYTADFVNHLGNTLTSPYIEQNTGCTPASVGLLWQTASGMISNVTLVEKEDCHYLRFFVNSVPATNGLAVLFVKDSNGDIMWSWTVWCTTDNLSCLTLTNYTEVDYDMMGVPFGAIWDANRASYVIPYYQWGRKDAFVPAANNASGSNMTVYDIDGNSLSWTNTSTSGGAVIGSFGTDADQSAAKTVANSIKNPGLFFIEYDTTSYNWNNLTWFNNFWNAAETASGSLADNQSTAVKTIYDPCPVGFTLPSARFATGFTTTGTNSSTAAEFNVIGSFSRGWTFKKNGTDTEGVYFPAAGSRYRTSSGLYNVGSNGYFWSFAPYSQATARYLYFYSGTISPLDIYYRAYGFAVWPARELN